MSHYITVPVNANGIIFDPQMNGVVSEAMAVTPFGFEDVYVYSHGWSTNADNAMDVYSKFSVELARSVLTEAQATPSAFVNPPQGTLGIGVHWPSEITEDPDSPLNAAQILTFYTMEHRAEAVGRNAVYAILRLVLGARAGLAQRLRIFLIGHSFGAKVVLAALQDLQTDIAGGTVKVPARTQFRVVLLQAATDNDNLENGDIYGEVAHIGDLRLLLTTSSKDETLGTWYPLAGKLANLFHAPPPALGYGGPSAATTAPTCLGAAAHIAINAGFTSSGLSGVTNRLVVADLSAIHSARIAAGAFKPTFLAGSHDDISFEEVYQMIGGFFYL